MASRDSTTWRCTTVVVTGVLWVVIGVALVGGAAALLVVRGPGSWAPAAVLTVVGVLLGVSGVGFLRARVEIQPDAIVATWAFVRRSYPLDDLVDATLAAPLRLGARGGTGSSTDWVNAGSNGIVMGVGYLIKLVFHVLGWVAAPGSTDGESLHLIPRLGGAIPVPAIATRIDRRNDSAHVALGAVHQAIVAHRAARGDRPGSPEEPPVWGQPLPRRTDGGGLRGPPG